MDGVVNHSFEIPFLINVQSQEVGIVRVLHRFATP